MFCTLSGRIVRPVIKQEVNNEEAKKTTSKKSNQQQIKEDKDASYHQQQTFPNSSPICRIKMNEFDKSFF